MKRLFFLIFLILFGISNAFASSKLNEGVDKYIECYIISMEIESLLSSSLDINLEEINYLQNYLRESQKYTLFQGCSVKGSVKNRSFVIIEKHLANKHYSDSYEKILVLVERLQDCTNVLLKFESEKAGGTEYDSKTYFQKALNQRLTEKIAKSAGKIKDYENLVGEIHSNQRDNVEAHYYSVFKSIFSMSNKYKDFDIESYKEAFAERLNIKFVTYDQDKILRIVEESIFEAINNYSKIGTKREFRDLLAEGDLKIQILETISNNLKKLEIENLGIFDDDIEYRNSQIEATASEAMFNIMDEFYKNLRENVYEPQIEKVFHAMDQDTKSIAKKKFEEFFTPRFSEGQNHPVSPSILYLLNKETSESLEKKSGEFGSAKDIHNNTLLTLINSYTYFIGDFIKNAEEENLCFIDREFLYSGEEGINNFGIFLTDSSWNWDERYDIGYNFKFREHLTELDFLQKIGVIEVGERDFYKVRLNSKPLKYYFIDSAYVSCFLEEKVDEPLNRADIVLEFFTREMKLDLKDGLTIKEKISFLEKHKKEFVDFYKLSLRMDDNVSENVNTEKLALLAYDSIKTSYGFIYEFNKKISDKIEKAKNKFSNEQIKPSVPKEFNEDLEKIYNENIKIESGRHPVAAVLTSEDKAEFVKNAMALRSAVEAFKGKALALSQVRAHPGTFIGAKNKNSDLKVFDKNPQFTISFPNENEANEILNSFEKQGGGEYESPFVTRKVEGVLQVKPSQAELSKYKDAGALAATLLSADEKNISKAACKELARIQFRNLMLLEIKYSKNPDISKVKNLIEKNKNCNYDTEGFSKIFDQEKEGILEENFREKLLREIDSKKLISDNDSILSDEVYIKIRSHLLNLGLDDETIDEIMDLVEDPSVPVKYVLNDQEITTNFDQVFFSKFLTKNNLTDKLHQKSPEHVNAFLNDVLSESKEEFVLYKLASIIADMGGQPDSEFFEKLKTDIETINEDFEEKKFNFSKMSFHKINDFYYNSLANLAVIARENSYAYSKIKRLEENVLKVPVKTGFIDGVRYAYPRIKNYLDNQKDLDPEKQKRFVEEKKPLPVFFEENNSDNFQKILAAKIDLNPDIFSFKPVESFLSSVIRSETGEYGNYTEVCERYKNELEKLKEDTSDKYNDLSGLVLNRVINYGIDEYEYRLRRVQDLIKNNKIKLPNNNDSKLFMALLKKPNLLTKDLPQREKNEEVAKMMNHYFKGRKDGKNYSLSFAGQKRSEYIDRVNEIFIKAAESDEFEKKEYVKYKVFKGYLKDSRHNNKSFSEYYKGFPSKVSIKDDYLEEFEEEKRVLDFVNRFLDRENEALKKMKILARPGTIRFALFEQLGFSGIKYKSTNAGKNETINSYLDLSEKSIEKYWYESGRFKKLNLKNLKGSRNPHYKQMLRLDNEYMNELNRMMIVDNFGEIANPERGILRAKDLPDHIARDFFDIDKNRSLTLDKKIEVLEEFLNNDANIIVSRENKNFNKKYKAVEKLHKYLEKEKADLLKSQTSLGKPISGFQNEHIVDYYNNVIHLSGEEMGTSFFDRKENMDALEGLASAQGKYVPFDEDAKKLKFLDHIYRDLMCESKKATKGNEINVTEIMQTKEGMNAYIDFEKKRIEKLLPAFGLNLESGGKKETGFYDIYRRIKVLSKKPEIMLERHKVSHDDYESFSRRKSTIDELIELNYSLFAGRIKKEANEKAIGTQLPTLSEFKALILGGKNSFSHHDISKELDKKSASLILNGVKDRSSYKWNLGEINKIKKNIEADYASTFLFEKGIQRAKKNALEMLQRACACEEKDYKALLEKEHINSYILGRAGSDMYLSGKLSALGSVIPKGWQVFEFGTQMAYMPAIFLLPGIVPGSPLSPALSAYWTAMVPVMVARSSYNWLYKIPKIKKRAEFSDTLGRTHVVPESSELISMDGRKYRAMLEEVKSHARVELAWDTVIVVPHGGIMAGKFFSWGGKKLSYNKTPIVGKPGIRYSGNEKMTGFGNPEGITGLISRVYRNNKLPDEYLEAQFTSKEIEAIKKLYDSRNRALGIKAPSLSKTSKTGTSGKELELYGGITLYTKAGELKNIPPQTIDDVFLLAVERVLGKRIPPDKLPERLQTILTGKRDVPTLFNMMRESKDIVRGGGSKITSKKLSSLLEALENDTALSGIKDFLRSENFKYLSQVRKKIKAAMDHRVLDNPLNKKLGGDLLDLFSSKEVASVISKWKKSEMDMLFSKLNGLRKTNKITKSEYDFINDLFRQRVGKLKVNDSLVAMIEENNLIKGLEKIKDPVSKRIKIEQHWGQIKAQYPKLLEEFNLNYFRSIDLTDAKLLSLARINPHIKEGLKIDSMLKVSKDGRLILDANSEKRVIDALRERLFGISEESLRVLLTNAPDPRRTPKGFLYHLTGGDKASGGIVREYLRPDFKQAVPSIVMYKSRLSQSERIIFEKAQNALKHNMYPGRFIVDKEVKTLENVLRQDIELFNKALKLNITNKSSVAALDDLSLGIKKYEQSLKFLKDEIAKAESKIKNADLLKLSSREINYTTKRLDGLKKALTIREKNLFMLNDASRRARFATDDIKGLVKNLTYKDYAEISENIIVAKPFRLSRHGTLRPRPLTTNKYLENRLDVLKARTEDFTLGPKLRAEALKRYNAWIEAIEIMTARKELFGVLRAKVGNSLKVRALEARKWLDERKDHRIKVSAKQLEEEFHTKVKLYEKQLSDKLKKLEEIQKGRGLERAAGLKSLGKGASTGLLIISHPKIYGMMREILPSNFTEHQINAYTNRYFRELFSIQKGERVTYSNLLERSKALSQLLKKDRNAAVRKHMRAMFGDKAGLVEIEGLDSVKWAMAERRLKQQLQEIDDIWAILLGEEVKAEALAKHMSNHFEGKLGEMANGIYKNLLTYGKEKPKDSKEISSIKKVQQLIMDYLKIDNPKEFNLSDPKLAKKAKLAINKIRFEKHPDHIIGPYEGKVHNPKIEEINLKFDNEIKALVAKGLRKGDFKKQKSILEAKRIEEIKKLEEILKAKTKEATNNYAEIKEGLEILWKEAGRALNSK